MKLVKYLSIAVCAATLLLAGCKSSTCCKADGSAAKASCGMQCCTDAKTDCAHCAKCSPKK